MQIERIIPGLAEDARHAVELLHREERPPANVATEVADIDR